MHHQTAVVMECPVAVPVGAVVQLARVDRESTDLELNGWHPSRWEGVGRAPERSGNQPMARAACTSGCRVTARVRGAGFGGVYTGSPNMESHGSGDRVWSTRSEQGLRANAPPRRTLPMRERARVRLYEPLTGVRCRTPRWCRRPRDQEYVLRSARERPPSRCGGRRHRWLRSRPARWHRCCLGSWHGNFLPALTS
jgi:hypothetical protein